MQLFAGAMGPPGGGRNDITSRFTRHLQVVSIDDFDDNTMIRIFTAITDWHFAKGFDSAFNRMGKVSIKTTPLHKWILEIFCGTFSVILHTLPLLPDHGTSNHAGLQGNYDRIPAHAHQESLRVQSAWFRPRHSWRPAGAGLANGGEQQIDTSVGAWDPQSVSRQTYRWRRQVCGRFCTIRLSNECR